MATSSFWTGTTSNDWSANRLQGERNAPSLYTFQPHACPVCGVADLCAKRSGIGRNAASEPTLAALRLLPWRREIRSGSQPDAPRPCPQRRNLRRSPQTRRSRLEPPFQARGGAADASRRAVQRDGDRSVAPLDRFWGSLGEALRRAAPRRQRLVGVAPAFAPPSTETCARKPHRRLCSGATGEARSQTCASR